MDNSNHSGPGRRARERLNGTLRVGAFLLLLGAGAFLSACGGGRQAPISGVSQNGPAPVQLGARESPVTAQPPSVVGSLDEGQARKAIENYRLSKKRAKGPYQLAGVDLNGDGQREAVVLFQGKDWCTNTGCSMAVFQMFEHGFRPISRTVRVKAPVAVATDVTNGYRDFLVMTGGGPAPERRVRLRFSGEGYSRNAMLQTEVPLGSAVRTETIFASSPGPATAANQLRSARNP